MLQLFNTRRDLLGTQFAFPTLRTTNSLHYSNNGPPIQQSSQGQNFFHGERGFLKRFEQCETLFAHVQEETLGTT